MTAIDTNLAGAVDALLRARATGRLIDGLTSSLNTAEAFALQDAVSEQLGEVTGGWKCALPAGERKIAAPIFASLIQFAPGPVVTRAPALRYEPELAFILAHDLPPGAARDDVVAAIGETRIALELVHGRYADPDAVGPDEALADNLYNDGLLLGPIVDLAAPISAITIRDGSGTRSLLAAHPAGDPLAPLVWLANHGPHPLKAGMAIITGSFIAAQTLTADAIVEIGFGEAGSLTATFQFEERRL